MKSPSVLALVKHLLTPALAGLTAVSLAACATTSAPVGRASGSVRIEVLSAAYYGSAASGKGSLNFNGQRRPFTITAVGAGGLGGQKVSATGKVYHLDSISDFAGTYRGVSSGLTLIEGSMHAKLTNENGVELYLAGETEGLASSLGVQAFKITLGD